MNDPHVVSIRYKLETAPTVLFDNPSPLEVETDKFVLFLEEGDIIVKLKEHFSSAEDARKVIDPYLRAWELDVALHSGREEINFTYVDAELIDRNPPPPGSPQKIQLSGIAMGTSFGTATLTVSRRAYPSPPEYFIVNPDVETLWYRFDGYKQGHEPLPSMAYFCLTFLETRAGGRKNAAKLYRIQKTILDMLGQLTTNRGDERTARKMTKDSSQIELSSTETQWIEASIKAIISRVGEIDTNPKIEDLTMSDLPNLK